MLNNAKLSHILRQNANIGMFYQNQNVKVACLYDKRFICKKNLHYNSKLYTVCNITEVNAVFSVTDFFNVKSIFLNLLVYSSIQILPSPVYDSDTSLVTMIKKKPLKKPIEYTAS